MNRLHPPLLLPTLLLPILLLADCGAEGPAESGETGGTGAAPSSVGPVADVVPEQDTCRSLFDQDGSGLFTEVTGWLMDGKEPDQENAAEASALSTRMEDVEAVAEPDFAPMIGVFRDPRLSRPTGSLRGCLERTGFLEPRVRLPRRCTPRDRALFPVPPRSDGPSPDQRVQDTHRGLRG